MIIKQLPFYHFVLTHLNCELLPFGTSLQYKFVGFEEGVTFNMSLVGFKSMTKTVLDANFISWGLSTGSHREQGHFTSAVINIIITFQL